MTIALGVLGGSFDPVHNGHLAIARNAIDHLHLQIFYLIPAGSPPHKQSQIRASAHDRVHMLRLAAENLNEAIIWDGELHRDGPSYTIDTIHELKRMHPNAAIHFIIGSDNLTEIPTWHRYQEFLAEVVLCVASRPGFQTQIPKELSAATIKEFPSPQSPISSTEIRRRVAENLPIEDLTPKPVCRYIQEKGLYEKK